MATKVIIPTSYGSPSATFSINGNNYVLPTGVETTVPDEVALLISQHEAQKKRERAQVHPDTVDVVFTFAGFNATGAFSGTSNKSLEDIVKELGGRGIEHVSLRVKSPEMISMPYKIEIYANQLTARWIGSSGSDSNNYGLLIYVATLTNTSGFQVTGAPRASFTGSVI